MQHRILEVDTLKDYEALPRPTERPLGPPEPAPGPPGPPPGPPEPPTGTPEPPTGTPEPPTETPEPTGVWMNYEELLQPSCLGNVVLARNWILSSLWVVCATVHHW